MGMFGVPSEISALQSTQAQHLASKAKAGERAASERSKREEDAVEFKVAGLEDAAALRKADEEASEDESKRRRERDPKSTPDSEEASGDSDGRLDLTA